MFPSICPLEARIDGLPNLLPSGLFSTGLTDKEAYLVFPSICPLEARIDGLPNLLPSSFVSIGLMDKEA